MKREKDIPAQEKARSHGYCCPYRQWVNRDFADVSSIESFPIVFNSFCYVCVANDVGGGCKILGISATSKTNYTVYQPTNNATWYGAIFLGK